MTKYKIRERTIRGGKFYRDGMRYASDEVQVVLGRRVIGRHDTRAQAERHIERLEADDRAAALTKREEP